MATSRVGAFTSLPTGVMTGFITSTCHQIKIIPEKDGAVLFLFRLVHDAAAAASLLFNGKVMLLTGGAKDVEKKVLHRPGIEPGPPAWQASILPLNHRCCCSSVYISRRSADRCPN
jgi:hypothetical protein